MATDVLKVPGDYKIVAKNGDIILDLFGATTGTVRIYGNLDIVGTSTSIISTNTFVQDKVLVLNYQTDGTPPVDPTGNVGGILIDSFSGDPADYATLFFNYDSVWGNGSTSSYGVFEFEASSRGSAINVNAIRIDPATALLNSANTSTLNFLGAENPNSVLSVAGTFNYEDNVIDDDDIPNKKYVDNRMYTGTVYAKKLQVGNSFIEINDSASFDEFYSSSDKIFASLGGNEVFRLEGTTGRIQGLTINGTTLAVNTYTSSTSITLQPIPGSGVVIDGALRMVDQTTATFTAVTDQTTLYYSQPAGGGGTGIYFVNNNANDELVSRRKAIIYGIIF